MSTRIGYAGVLVMVAMLPGCLAEEGLSPPEGSVDNGKGVSVVKLENPALRGNVYLRSNAVSPSPDYVEVRTMSPDGAYLVPDTPGVMRDLGWLSNGLAPGVGGIGAPPFDAPAVSLPMGGAAVSFDLFKQSGRTRTTPVPSGTIPPAVGVDVEHIDTMRVALDPNVLVLPVRVYAFVNASGSQSYWRGRLPLGTEAMSQILDPGSVRTISELTEDDGYQSRVITRSGLLDRSAFEPDAIWTQCDIQFHLESVQIIPQSGGLERDLYDSCLSNFNGFAPLRPYLAGSDDAIPVYVGGDIARGGGTGCGFAFDVLGLSNAHRGCSTAPYGGPTADDSILISGRFFPQALSHELGHFLGLGHTDDPLTGRVCAADAVGASGNLMGSGSSTGTLTAGQCGYARCVAGRRLASWGRIPASRSDALCAGL